MSAQDKKVAKAPPPPEPKTAPEPEPPVALEPEVAPPAPPPSERAPELPVASKPLAGDLTPDQEIAELEKRIASDQARVYQLQHPVIEFPKWVNGRLFNSRAEQDAAGPDFKDLEATK
jgi:hypothetical protein